MHEELQFLREENKKLTQSLSDVSKNTLSRDQFTQMITKLSTILIQTERGCYKNSILASTNQLKHKHMDVIASIDQSLNGDRDLSVSSDDEVLRSVEGTRRS
jgi:hypothetical protein